MSIYSDYIISLAPISYWRLNETSGTLATDSMGLHNGVYSGSPVLNNPGLFSATEKSVALNGIDQFIGLTSGSATPSTPCTVVMSVKLDSTKVSGFGSLIELGTKFGGRRLDVNYVNKTLNVYAVSETDSPIAIPFDISFHLVAIWDTVALKRKLYINNVLANEFGLAATTGNYGEFRIGAHTQNSYYSKCLIENVALFNKVLTVDQINILYNKLIPGTAQINSGPIVFKHRSNADGAPSSLKKNELAVNTKSLTLYGAITKEVYDFQAYIISKLLPYNSGWNYQAYSTQGYNGSSVTVLSFKLSSMGSVMIGLNSDPATNNSYETIDFAVFGSYGHLSVYENGTGTSIGPYTDSDILSIEYFGGTISYKKNGVTYRTQTIAAGTALYFDSSYSEQFDISAMNLIGNTTLTKVPYLDDGTQFYAVSKDSTPGGTWAGQAYSTNSFTNNCCVSFTPVSTQGGPMVGLNSDPTTNDSFETLDYAILLNGGGVSTFSIFESGGSVAGPFPYIITDWFQIKYIEDKITYWKNYDLIHTTTATAGLRLYLDSSYWYTGPTIKYMFFGEIVPPTVYELSLSLNNVKQSLTIQGDSPVISFNNLEVTELTKFPEFPTWREKVGIPGDPDYNIVSLLLPFTGANNSVVITDNSKTPHSFTVLGNTHIDTSFPDPFGNMNGVAIFGGNGDYITTPSVPDLTFGTGAFTIEVWVYKTSYPGGSSPGDEIIFGSPTNAAGTSGTAFFLENATGAPSMFNGVNAVYGAGALGNAAGMLPLNQWNHVAWTYDGTTMRTFLNGKKQGELVMTHNHNNIDSIRIGGNHQGDFTRFFHGRMSNYKLTYGKALYVADFSLPTRSFYANAPTVKYVNKQVGTGWDKFKRLLDNQIQNAREAGMASGVKQSVNPAGTFSGNYVTLGTVLLPDGRVFLVPYGSTTARIYDPLTNTLTVPSGTYPGSNSLGRGVLLPDGRVFCCPITSTTARIYDPATDTVITPNGTYPGTANAFSGCVLLSDGRVFIVPGSSTSARIYDPVNDTLTTPSGTYPGNFGCNGGVLLPDGRVFITPFNSTTARIYDPVTDTLITPNGTYEPATVARGTLMADGRIFMAEGAVSDKPGVIYDPVADTLTILSVTFPNPGYSVSVLLPDGRLFCVPYGGTQAAIYDPIQNTLSLPIGSYTNEYSSACVLNNGRVYMTPDLGTSAAIALTGNGMPVDPQIIHSPFVITF
jgi:hypothetical protein